MHPPVRTSGLAGSARSRASSAPTARTVASFRSPIRSFAGTSPARMPMASRSSRASIRSSWTRRASSSRSTSTKPAGRRIRSPSWVRAGVWVSPRCSSARGRAAVVTSGCSSKKPSRQPWHDASAPISSPRPWRGGRTSAWTRTTACSRTRTPCRTEASGTSSRCRFSAHATGEQRLRRRAARRASRPVGFLWPTSDRLSCSSVEIITQEAERRGRVLGVRLPPQDEDDDPWAAPPSRWRHELPLTGELPASLELVLGNQVYIPKSALHPALRNRLLRLAAFQNPEFYRSQAMRLSTYDKPRVIACAEDYPRPRGLAAGLSARRSSRPLRHWAFARSCPG